jgi:cell fate (sporulation/competence/biofilm development) regulator YlbF (YheA/YmcA/DUF963 family)
MKKTNPTFKCDDGSSLSETGKPDNTCIRKAWKDFKDTYGKETNGNTDIPKDEKDKGDKGDKKQTGDRKIDCTLWTTDNPFKRDFPGKEAEAVYDFLRWYTGFYPYTFAEGGFYHGQCGITERFPYIVDSKNKIEENAVLKDIATKYRKLSVNGQLVQNTTYDIWKPTYDKKQKVTPEVKKEKIVAYDEEPSDLTLLFDISDSIMDVTGVNMKTDRKTCIKLINAYWTSYKLHNGEKNPGMSRNEFAQKMTKTKRQIYYCVKEHPNMVNRIETFRNIANLDWKISMSNVEANALTKENKIEMKNRLTESIRKKLVEAKMVKSLKVEITKKSLLSISENFYKQNYRKFFTQMFLETKKLQNNNGLINESVGDTFQKAFNSLFSGNEEKIKQETINHIIKELGVDANSQMGGEIANELNTTPDSEVSRLMSDPTFVADKVTSAIDKVVVHDDVDNDSLEGMLKSSAVSNLKSTMDDIKFKIAHKITDTLNKSRENVERTSNEVKKSFIDRLSDKISGI